MKDVKIKSCPFCGNKDKDKYSMTYMGNVYQIACGSCGAFGPAADTEDGAVKVWNGRMMAVINDSAYDLLQKMNKEEEDEAGD